MFGHDTQSNDDNNQTGEPHISAVNSSNTPLPDAADQTWQHPGPPLDTEDTPAGGAPHATPPSGTDQPAATPPPLSPPAPADDPVPANDLVDIKRQALTQLSPLVGHLDQTPEEKFRTTMMMIQASDDQSLISTAYETAQNITDEKARAQALLDIVNEINYFTQHADPDKA